MTTHSRPARVAEEFRQELGAIIARGLKDDVREVAQGLECGIGIEGFGDVKPGDVLEAYELEEIRPSLD